MKKPMKFFYSEEQDELPKGIGMINIGGHRYNKTEVYIDGKWHRYSEMRKSGGSNFADAVFLGTADVWDIRVNGVIQMSVTK